MKKLLYILFASAVMILTASCTDDSSSDNEGKSAVTFSVKGIVSRTGTSDNTTELTPEEALVEAVMPKLSFRIYSIVGKKETFIRTYSGAEISDMKIWLVPGKYKVTVEGGDQVAATFNRAEAYYYGEKEFKIVDGNDNHNVVVECNPQNVMIKIRYDQSVKSLVESGDLEDVKTLIAITDDISKISESSNLSYELYMEDIKDGEQVVGQTLKEPSIGYYTFTEEQKSIVWCFEATDVAKNNRKVKKQNVYTPKDPTTNEPIGFRPGYVYTLTFKYSPDLGGYVSLQVSANKSETEFNDVVEFKPAPQFSGDYVNRVVAVYKGMNEGKGLKYTIKAINPLSSVKVYIGTTEISEGVNVSETSDKEWIVTLNDDFIGQLSTGEKNFRIVVEDEANATSECKQDYKGEGAYKMEVTDKWNGKASFKAYVNNPAITSGKIYYRKNGTTEWNSVDMTVTDGVGTADGATGIIGNATYEYYMSYSSDNDTPIRTGVITIDTEATKANPIPNGGMEEWGKAKNNNYTYVIPYINKRYWDCGNHGSSTASTSVTIQSSDKRSQSNGSYSALLDSQKASIAFAAGNIYVGAYLGTSGANGAIGYGQPFDFDYEPKKLTVWYKGAVGKIDNADDNDPVKINESDKSQIFVWLCNRPETENQQYLVFTGKSETFINANGTYAKALDVDYTNYGLTVPAHSAGDKVEGLVAWGSWSRTQTGVSVNGGAETTDIDGTQWTKIEIPLQYVGTDKPNFLVISCAASAYGDYFAGSTDSYMYVDDFEFVY